MVRSAADKSQESSEDDWEDNYDNLDAVPAIGPAAEQAKQKVPTNLPPLHSQSHPLVFLLSSYACYYDALHADAQASRKFVKRQTFLKSCSEHQYDTDCSA